MPKKPFVSKSQAIRDYQVANPGEGPKAIAAGLKKQGIKVTAAFVSTIRSMDKRRAEHLDYGGIDSTAELSQLFAAKAFVAKVGGIDKALGVLTSLKRLQG